MHHTVGLSLGLAIAVALCGLSAAAEPPAAASTEIVKPLIDKDLVGAPDKELVMLTVEYLPGGASLPHRHDAQVFVYVLDGALTMQVAGGPLLTLHRGETFYEGPNDIHTVSANASKTAAAKILVFLVKDKRKAGTRPVPAAVTQ